MGCVADIQTQAAFKAYWAKRLEEDPDIDPTTTCSAIFWKKTPKLPQISGGLRRLAQLDSAGHGLQPAHLCLRLGDGYYPVYFGYDAKGKICAVYVRFIDIEASYREQD